MSTPDIESLIEQEHEALRKEKKKPTSPQRDLAAFAPAQAGSTDPEARVFRVDDNGLYVQVIKDQRQQFVRIGPALYVTARTRNADGEGCGKQVRFRNWEGVERNCIIPLAGLVGESKDSLDRLLHLGYQPKRDRRSIEALKDYIYQTHCDRFVRCVTSIGWHFGAFVFPDRTIAPKDSAEEVLFQSETPSEHKYRTKGTLDSWRQHVSRFCIGNSRLVFAVSCAFSAPLLGPMRLDGSGVHLRGLSSSGKTATLHAAGSVWGGSPQIGFLETWRATANGIEARAMLHNNALMCLDEIGEVSEKEAGEIVYALANGSGRGRMTRALTSRASNQFKLVFLSSGERALQDVIQGGGRQVKGGQEVRLLEVPADAGRGMGVFETIHGFSSPAELADQLTIGAKSNYGTAIDPFIRALVENREDVVEKVRRGRERFLKRHVTREDSGEVYRAASFFGLVAMAGEIATGLGLTGWPENEAWRAAEACFAAWIVNRGGKGARDIYHGIEALRGFLQTFGSSRFQDIGGQSGAIRDRAGFREKVDGVWRYYIFRRTFQNEICHGYDYQAIARELIRREEMAADADGRLVLSKRIPEMGTDRFFAVLPKFLSEGTEAEE